MQTQVIMRRNLFGSQISQQSKTEFFSATDLVKAGNSYRRSVGMAEFKLSEFLRTDKTKEFVEEIEKRDGKVVDAGRGRNAIVWVHPLLFIDIALAISPKLKLEVYDWIRDELLKYRNDSGDSYKKMCGCLYANCSDKSNFHRGVSKTAILIKDAVGVKDWQSATQEQLKLRDKIQDNISLLTKSLKDNNQAIKLGIYYSVH